MKGLLKRQLPPSIINKARDLRDRALLAVTAPLPLESSLLPPDEDLDIHTLLTQDPDIDTVWARDQARVASVLGVGERAGGVNPGDRRAIYQLVYRLRPRRVLEIGTHISASTLYIARALRSSCTMGTITTVDIQDVNDPVSGPWRRVGLRSSPIDMAGALKVDRLIDFKAMDSLDFLESLGDAALQVQYDLIFLDGDHTAGTVYREIALALPTLSDGGVLLLHDYYPNNRALYPDGRVITGPFRAMERISRENPAISVRPLGSLPWETKQGTNYTSLAVLVRGATDTDPPRR